MNPITFLRQKYQNWQTFRATMREWLGDGGKPVSPGKSKSRAAICAGCQFNQRTFSSEFLSAVAIRWLDAKKRSDILINQEADLGACRLCNCVLALKIHVPHEHIRAWQPDSVRQEILKQMPTCWQLEPDK